MTTQLVYCHLLSPRANRREVISVAARIQALLLVLGAMAAAAFGGSTPWGP
jgi:hypothetical protein